MKPITITLTEQTAEALLWALREPLTDHIQRHMELARCELVQNKLKRLLHLHNQISNHMTVAEMQGEQA